MRLGVILRITGILLMFFSLTMLVPIPIALAYEEPGGPEFGLSFLITLAFGLLLWLGARDRRELRSADGFLITVLFYCGLGAFGALPFLLSEHPSLDFTDAMFESFSGLTTTGATVISGLDTAPHALLFWRHLTNWLGGMGIVVLAVAVLPMLGVGGMQLYRTESPGPVKDNKLTPRITETAGALWYIYLALTLACALAYWLLGMSPFDAVCHAFSTVAIGGFSTHDASIGHFNHAGIEAVAIVFMVLSGINFALHFVAWRRRNLRAYWRDPEVRGYLAGLLGVGAAVCAALLLSGLWSTGDAIRLAAFHTVSIFTTTGFTTTDFSTWPLPAPVLLLFAAFVGGCAGSTAGGLKVVRVQLLFLQTLREIRRLIHPHAVIPIKHGRNPIPDRVIEAMWGFLAAYGMLFFALVLLILLTPIDFITAFSAVAACLNNLGPGLGSVSQNYAGLHDFAKWLLIVAMLLGRLEVFTVLVLLTPAFWRR